MRDEFKELPQVERQKKYETEAKRLAKLWREKKRDTLTQAELDALAIEYGANPIQLKDAHGWEFSSKPNPFGNRSDGFGGGI